MYLAPTTTVPHPRLVGRGVVPVILLLACLISAARAATSTQSLPPQPSSGSGSGAISGESSRPVVAVAVAGAVPADNGGLQPPAVPLPVPPPLLGLRSRQDDLGARGTTLQLWDDDDDELSREQRNLLNNVFTIMLPKCPQVARCQLSNIPGKNKKKKQKKCIAKCERQRKKRKVKKRKCRRLACSANESCKLKKKTSSLSTNTKTNQYECVAKAGPIVDTKQPKGGDCTNGTDCESGHCWVLNSTATPAGSCQTPCTDSAADCSVGEVCYLGKLADRTQGANGTCWAAGACLDDDECDGGQGKCYLGPNISPHNTPGGCRCNPDTNYGCPNGKVCTDEPDVGPTCTDPTTETNTTDPTTETNATDPTMETNTTDPTTETNTTEGPTCPVGLVEQDLNVGPYCALCINVTLSDSLEGGSGCTINCVSEPTACKCGGSDASQIAECCQDNPCCDPCFDDEGERPAECIGKRCTTDPVECGVTVCVEGPAANETDYYTNNATTTPPTVYEAVEMSPQNMDYDAVNKMFVAHSGWYNDKLVHYYKFRIFAPSTYPGVISPGSSADAVPTQKLYVVTTDGTFNGTVGNPILQYHHVDGVTYSDFMEVVFVTAPEGYQANTFQSEEDVMSSLSSAAAATMEDSGIMLNIPVVPTNSTLQHPHLRGTERAPIDPVMVWYKHAPVQTFIFEVTDQAAADFFASTRTDDPNDFAFKIHVVEDFATPDSVKAIPLWHVNQYTRGVTAGDNGGGPNPAGMRNIINLDRADAAYSPLWSIIWVTALPVNYLADETSNAADITTANGFETFTTPMFVNCPDVGDVGTETNPLVASTHETSIDITNESNWIMGSDRSLIFKEGVLISVRADGTEIATNFTNMMGAYEMELMSDLIPEGTAEITVVANDETIRTFAIPVTNETNSTNSTGARCPEGFVESEITSNLGSPDCAFCINRALAIDLGGCAVRCDGPPPWDVRDCNSDPLECSKKVGCGDASSSSSDDGVATNGTDAVNSTAPTDEGNGTSTNETNETATVNSTDPTNGGNNAAVNSSVVANDTSASPFQFERTLDDYNGDVLKMYWNAPVQDGDQSLLTARITSTGLGWVGIGFPLVDSTVGNLMLGSIVVLGMPEFVKNSEHANPGLYRNERKQSIANCKTCSLLLPMSNQTLTNATVGRGPDGSGTVMTFTMTLGEHDDTNPINATGANRIIWAYGYDTATNYLGYHKGRGSAIINFLTGEDE